mgnify:CR=1 FL=1
MVLDVLERLKAEDHTNTKFFAFDLKNHGLTVSSTKKFSRMVFYWRKS